MGGGGNIKVEGNWKGDEKEGWSRGWRRGGRRLKREVELGERRLK